VAPGSIRALVGVIGIGACFAGAAYAATQHQSGGDGPDRKARSGWLPKPAIGDRPDAQSPSTSARFGFTARTPGARFECRLDGAQWRPCRPPTVFKGLAVGHHRFSVRTVDRQGRHGAPAKVRWTILAAKDFSIVPDLSSLRSLYPGAPPIALPLTVTNPNPAPIFITGLRVAVAADPAGCSSVDNLALVQSNASSVSPLKVSAGGSAQLPAGRVLAPTIQLRDLPVNQDACKNARFPLEFSGVARG
jgi:hypothetical protein